MSTSAYGRIPVIILAALALAACPLKKDKKHDEPAVYWVSASDGSDTNPGTKNLKFKKITHALSVALRSGTTVHVAPGTYSNDETFPIIVPAGVLLIGDEDTKGAGTPGVTSPTSIVGGGLAPGSAPGDVGVAVLPGEGSTVAGFTITNNNSSFTERRGLILGYSSVTLRNNTVTGATHKAGIYVGASTNHMITGNHIVNNGGSSAGSGLAFGRGGVGSKVEKNLITGNGFGVEYDVAGGDLGSAGGAGSTGGNVISCNARNNLVSRATTTITITAAYNLWDHAPPTSGSSSGMDIFDSSGFATVNANPANLASSPCAPAASPMFFVNASSVGSDAGSDANPGTLALPFKTITHALTVATSGSTVQAKPGVYDTLNNGETFPIVVPDGVLLIGDEANTGGTSIVGRGPAPAGFAAATVTLLPGTGSTIAGFAITPDDVSIGHDGLLLRNSSVTLRNNTVSGASRYGVEFDAAKDHVITGNQIVNNSGQGLGFIKGGDGSKVEKNVITRNGVGVEYDVDGGDLGGGSKGSAGMNTISCNTYDLFVVAQTPITISAANNFWDHGAPALATPTFGCNAGDDICDFGTFGAPYVAATIITTNAASTVNPAACQ